MKITVRHILKNKLASGIILCSLLIGIVSIGLIGIFIHHEINTDSFLKDHDRIYSLNFEIPFMDGKIFSCVPEAGPYLKENYSQFEDYCRIAGVRPQKIQVNRQEYFDKPVLLSTSKNFFDFFTYNLMLGNPNTVLASDEDIVISEELAHKYFGNANPIGQKISVYKFIRPPKDTLLIEEKFVSGVFRLPTENSQLTFDMISLIGEQHSHCFIKMAYGTGRDMVENMLSKDRQSIPIMRINDSDSEYSLSSLDETYFQDSRYLFAQKNRSKSDLWVALVVGLMILGIAAINFIGLLRNQLIDRRNENSVRQISGGSKTQLVFNLAKENSLLILLSLILSFPAMVYLLPHFNKLVGATISESYLLQSNQLVIPITIGLLMLISSILYIISNVSYRVDINSLKSKKGIGPNQKVRNPAFNIIQISLSIVLIVGSLIIIRQMQFISNRPIGMEKETIGIHLPEQHVLLSDEFKNELIQQSSIASVSITRSSPLKNRFQIMNTYETNGEKSQYSPSVFNGDQDFVRTLGLEIIAGTGFSGNPESDKDKCIINESLAALFPGQDLVGKSLPGTHPKLVIGVVKDFHYQSLKSVVEPAFISHTTDGNHLIVRPKPGQTKQVRNAITQVWSKLIADYPPEMQTIGERYEHLHRENQQYIQFIGTCCFVSIFLSMIGLFAISYTNCKYRIKEIGIRKVNGAKISEILSLLNKDFVKWIGIAFIIATPIAWYAMEQWLQNFAYKSKLSWWVFALAGLITLAIALLTVSWQSWKAATRNPVEALKYE